MDPFFQRVNGAFTLLMTLFDELSRGSKEEGKLYRVEVELEGFEPLDEVSRVRGVGRYYWQGRDGLLEMGGWSEAEVIASERDVEHFSYASVFNELSSRLSAHSFGVRFYGGFKFNPLDRRGERWVQFRAYRFVVPRVEVVRRGEKTYLAVNIKWGNADVLMREIDEVVNSLYVWIFGKSSSVDDWGDGLLSESGRLDCPSYLMWLDLVNRTLTRIRSGAFDKVVLARETTFELKGEVDPMDLLRRVSVYGGWSYQFCFHPSVDRAFLGISPERLYRRTSSFIETEALAGTVRRGHTEGEDEQLKQMLLVSPKELKEHRIVVEMLKMDMEKLCVLSENNVQAQVVTLPTVHHLYTYFQGILRSGVSDAEIVGVLHPTPAVGGYPRGLALEWIRREEPIDRGVYSGPVGWVGYDSAEFCVGIRSALVQGDKISLYSGAGIVAGSQPELEWAELECKIQAYMNVLGQSKG